MIAPLARTRIRLTQMVRMTRLAATCRFVEHLRDEYGRAVTRLLTSMAAHFHHSRQPSSILVTILVKVKEQVSSIFTILVNSQRV